MKPNDLIAAILYPVTHAAVFVPIIVFTLLLTIADWAGILGLFLMLLVVPAVSRFMMIIIEARAKANEPETPGIEFFSLYGNAWSLFPFLLVLLLAGVSLSAGETFGAGGKIVVLLITASVLPASLAVLAITHSPLQSLNPVALGRLLKNCGATFWIASVFLIATVWLNAHAQSLPLLAANLITLYLVFSFSSLTGSLIEPYGLMDDVHIPDALELSEDELGIEVEKSRTGVLSHAYGFISRGNRDGGFKHIVDQISVDPDPLAAWAWYFDRMLQWENAEHALFFAQTYVHDMLMHGEKIPAVKVIMRCRLIDEQFKPRSDDIPAAIQAAEGSGNIELAAVLNRS